MKYSLGEDNKVMHAIYCRTIRELVIEANELNVLRNDIISILKEGEYYAMIYYYGGNTETV